MGEISSRVRIPLSPPQYAPVAQLDRVLGYEPRGRRFESFRARQLEVKTQKQKSLRNKGQSIEVFGPEWLAPKRFDKIRSEEHKVRRSILDARSAPRSGEEETT